MGLEANNRTTRLLTTDDGPQDEEEIHRTPNAERRTSNAEYESVAGSEGQRREWDNKTTDYGPWNVGAKRLVIGSQLSVNW